MGCHTWYTPTLLAPTHCAQTFLVVVCSVHNSASNQIFCLAVLAVSWGVLVRAAILWACLGPPSGSRTCLFSSTAMLVGNPAPRERAFCRAEMCGFWRSWLWADKIGFLLCIRLAQGGFIIFGNKEIEINPSQRRRRAQRKIVRWSFTSA